MAVVQGRLQPDGVPERRCRPRPPGGLRQRGGDRPRPVPRTEEEAGSRAVRHGEAHRQAAGDPGEGRDFSARIEG